jgi:predicted DCC family thiol-disulfide oxidoreductase YuxK
VEPGVHIVFYDGVCGLCDRLVRFLLARDREARFRFAALQSAFAREVLAGHGADASDLDSVYVIGRWATDSQVLLKRSRAVLFAVAALGWPWRIALVLRVVPVPILDWGYDRVARVRYRVFGRFDACRLPRPEERDRFIDA